jgi:hypothetical protein
MLVSRLRAIAAAASLGSLSAAASCAGSRAPRTLSPPPVEFLISTPDSTYWVATSGGSMHVRGVPLLLARYNDRFYEIYATDDDHSYDNAQLVGARLYRRDLLTGDSTAVFTDTAVARVAGIYARTHPGERPLNPEEDGETNPQTSATADIDILEVFGPFLSYEYRVDIELPSRAPWHSIRRGVLDLRTGKQTSVADLIGPGEGTQVISAGRRAYEVARDSAVRAERASRRGDERAIAALERRRFDPMSFSVEQVGGKPALTFGIPGEGEGTAGNLVELDPVTIDSASWWRNIQPSLGEPDSSDNDHWAGQGYSVLARYDSASEIARISIVDSAKREWHVVSATGPVWRIDWLDHPPASDAERIALRRAFDQAAQYDENARVASRGAQKNGASLASLHRARPAIRHARGRRSSEGRARVSSWSHRPQPARNPRG